MTRIAAETAGMRDAAPLDGTDTAGPAWGACRIGLVADRVPSVRAGSTHKVYRGWRFAAAMQQGQPQSGAILFTVPIDPGLLATSRSRYALVQLTAPGAGTGEDPASFSWSPSTIGTADPFAEAQSRAQRRLEAAGWTQDAVVPTRYAKPDPSAPAVAPTASRLPEATGLDGWEMDGGA